jgi:glycine/D-amino acid oxidase-like deaminating enzyme
MKIAIIGAGNVGTALAHATATAGHVAVISAAHPEHAEATAAQTGATAASSNVEAVKGADVVVLAVPYAARRSRRTHDVPLARARRPSSQRHGPQRSRVRGLREGRQEMNLDVFPASGAPAWRG